MLQLSATMSNLELEEEFQSFRWTLSTKHLAIYPKCPNGLTRFGYVLGYIQFKMHLTFSALDCTLYSAFQISKQISFWYIVVIIYISFVCIKFWVLSSCLFGKAYGWKDSFLDSFEYYQEVLNSAMNILYCKEAVSNIKHFIEKAIFHVE